MKRSISLLCIAAMLLGLLTALTVMPVSAETSASLEDSLITHWDFEGDTPLADKATNGANSDTLTLYGGTTVANGVATIPNYTQADQNNSVMYAANSNDFFRTVENRTVFMRFKCDHVLYSTDDAADRLVLVAQNGAIHIGFHSDNDKLFQSTSVGSIGENWAMTDGMLYQPNTWITVAVAYDKSAGNGQIKIDTFFKVDGGEWITGTVTQTDTAQTWTQEDYTTNAINSSKFDHNSLIIGRQLASFAGSGWGGTVTYDDVRIYSKSLTLADVKSITDVTSAGHSLTLGGDIGVNFFLNAGLGNTDATVTIQNGETVLLDADFSDAYKSTQIAGAYKFTANVPAKEMADKLTLTVKSGEKVLYTEEYSVLDYAKVILADETTYANEIPLVQAMLNYGGYAQDYFNYNTENLANAGLNISLADVSLTEKDAIKNGSVAGVASVKATLKLESKTEIVFTVTFEDGADLSAYTVNGEVPTAKVFTVITDGINAQDLDVAKTLEITDGTDTATVSYSALTYIQNCADEAEVADLLKALYAYYTAAEIYTATAA